MIYLTHLHGGDDLYAMILHGNNLSQIIEGIE